MREPLDSTGIALRWIVLALLAGIPAAAAAQDVAPNQVLTLDDALTLAIAQNRLVNNARLEVQKAELEVDATRTHRLPSFGFTMLEGGLLGPLNFEFKAGAFGTFGATGPIPSSDTIVRSDSRPNTAVLIRAVQPLSQLHRIGLGIRQLELGSEIARQRLRGEEQSVARNVKLLYYGILQTTSAIAARTEALRLYRELDRLVSDYVARQVALESDSLDVRTRLAQGEQELLVLGNSQAGLKEQLNALLGRDISAPVEVAPVPESVLFDMKLEDAQSRAPEQRPEVQEARLKLRQAEYDVRVKKSEAIPDISLTFNYIGLYNVDLLPPHILSAGVLLNYEPFDWGRKKFELGAREATLQQAQAGVRETEALVRIDVSNRFRKVHEAIGVMRVGRLAREAAQEKLRVALDRYRAEASLLRETLERQTELAEATDRYEQMLLAFWTAKAEFEKALGER